MPSISTKDGTQIYRKDRAERQPVLHNDHVNGGRLRHRVSMTPDGMAIHACGSL